jgi:hypothetical protein
MPPGPLIVVDAANVIGARPDGWWRDRAGAVRRLLSALAGSLTDQGDVVLVVEGAARAGVEPGTVDGVRVVHAPRSGDDEIVALVEAATGSAGGRPVTVVTADRELRERVEALGAEAVGPQWLWRQLDRDP